MEEYKKTTIFDLLQEKTYNPFFDEFKSPMDAILWSIKNGNFQVMKAYLETTDPTHYDPKSKKYKERIQGNKPRPFIIDDKYCIICTKEQLKEQYPESYLKYYGDDENDR